MKALLALLLLGNVAFSQTLKSGKFLITGDVSRVQPSVRMIKMTYSVNGVNQEDTASVINGTYQFSGSIAEPRMGFFSAVYKDDSVNKKPDFKKDYFAVYLEQGAIRIKSLNIFSNIKVSGSRAHDVFERLTAEERPYHDQTADLYNKISELKKLGKDEEAKAFVEQIKEIDEKRKEKVLAAFVRSNPSSPIALYALDAYAGYKMDVNEVEPLFGLLSKQVKDTWSGKEFQAKLEGAKRTRIGAQAIEFTQADTLGQPVSLSSFKGKFVLVDFWASWCYPCREENPNVVSVFQKYKDRNFTVLGVSLERPDAKEAWLEAIRKDKLTWTNVSDFKFFDNAVAKLYGITAIPRNLLIDPEGKIVATDLRGEDLHRKLEELIK